MSHDDINRWFDQAESEIIQLNQTISTLREKMTHLVEMNNQLRLTNQNLKTELIRKTQLTETDSSTKVTPKASNISGRQRLQKFYSDGIHICHPYFGKPFNPDESCIFCQELLDHIGGDKP